MGQTPGRDPYAILGISPGATAEEMREAYLSRARVIHPDRFDPQRQPQDWRKANDMLAELNEAYAFLRDRAARSPYREPPKKATPNSQPSSAARPETTAESVRPSSIGFEELTPGKATFASLPPGVRDRLLQRQRNRAKEQFQLRQSSIIWAYIFIVVALGWYCYLFAVARGSHWDSRTNVGFGAVTLLVAYIIGRNLLAIERWSSASLKPSFYVTPLYFVRTEFDVVRFWPIWSLKDIAVTHNHRGIHYQGSTLELGFDGHRESLFLSSKNQVEKFLAFLDACRTQLRTAYSRGDKDYLLRYDDFRGVPRSNPAEPVLPSRGTKAFVYLASVVLCGVGFCAAVMTNRAGPRESVPGHPQPGSRDTRPPPSRAQQAPNYPTQPMPYSGAIYAWTEDRRVAPLEIKASQDSHYLLKLVDAFTGAPALAVFVRAGTTVNVDVPLGTFEVRYAAGDTWYGYQGLFGPDTSYCKAHGTFTFRLEGRKLSGFSITLFKVVGGNLQTSAIRPEEF